MADPEETPTQLAARLRREKRQAKLAATGEDRLAKIKQLNGGVAPPEEVLGGPTVAPTTSTQTLGGSGQQASVADDPDEVDISSHPYTPANGSGKGTPREGQGGMGGGDDELMRGLLRMQGGQGQGQGQGRGQDDGTEDPMLKIMQSLLGGQGGSGGGGAGIEGMEGMPQMLSAMMGAGGPATQQQPATSSAYLWRITHAIFALTLAAYIALTSTFNGTQLSRLKTIDPTTGLDTDRGIGPRLFWIFVTSELLLQSTRWLMEQGQLQGGGWLAMIANSGFVPEPYAGYVRTVGSYIRIWTTVVSDAMVVVFVLGCLAWWKGGVGAEV